MPCPTAGRCSHDASFRVGEGAKAALVGANGAGKTTLLRLIAGDLTAQTGASARAGGLGVMRQFIGSVRDATTVQDFLVGLSPAAVARGLGRAAGRRAGADGARRRAGPAGLRARARRLGRRRRLRRRGAVGHRHRRRARCCPTNSASTASWPPCPAASRSGWRSSCCCAARTRCCCSTSRTTTSTSPASAGSSSGCGRRPRRSCSSATTASCWPRVADRVVTVEGGTAWVHGGGFASLPRGAQRHRHERMAELRRRWEEEHARLKELVRTLQQQAKYQRVDGPEVPRHGRAGSSASRPAGPPPDKPEDQQVTMRLRGRTHRRARGHLRAAASSPA